MTLDGHFDAKNNSLNAIRLILATLVIVSHSWALGGYGPQPSLGGIGLGTWAVFGFFLISGYLITRSRLERTVTQYYRARFFRIMPGYVVCILVVAFAFAPLSLLLGATGYSLVDASTYVLRNLLLYPPGLWQHGIGATLDSVPYPGFWNGSLWTLFYEAACYVMIGILVSLLPRRALPIAIGVILVITTAIALTDAVGLTLPTRIVEAARLAAAFSAGALLFLTAKKIRVNAATVAAATILTVLTIVAQVPALGLLPLGFLLILGSMQMRLNRVGRSNDISYGMYIYAWPVQQTLALAFPNQQLPLVALIALCIVATVPFAWASWALVEKPANSWGRARRKMPVSVEPAI